MSNPVKGSAEWFEAKAQARKDLDAKLALGIRHGAKLPIIGASMPKAPKADKPARKPKAPKAAK